MVSIKQIVQRMIVGQDAECLELQLPGELSSCHVRLPPLSPALGLHHFWLPNVAGWCPKLDACLRESLPGLAVKLAEPGELASLHSRGQAKRIIDTGRTRNQNLGYLMSSTEAIESRGSRATNNDEELTAVVAPLAHAMLLPLNKDTLLNGKVLADLWAAMRLNLPLVLLHLQEEEYDAAPFSSFFAQCPPHLKVSGSECPTHSFTSRFYAHPELRAVRRASVHMVFRLAT